MYASFVCKNCKKIFKIILDDHIQPQCPYCKSYFKEQAHLFELSEKFENFNRIFSNMEFLSITQGKSNIFINDDLNHLNKLINDSTDEQKQITSYIIDKLYLKLNSILQNTEDIEKLNKLNNQISELL